MSYKKLPDKKRKSDEVGFYQQPTFVETLQTCWGLGPLDVCVTKISDERIDVSIKLGGIKIGSGSITTNNNSLCAGANVELVKANLCVEADFKKKEVWVVGEVCSRRWDGDWNCDKFKTILISW